MLGASGMKRILVTGVGGSAAINFVRAVRAANEKVYIVGTDSSEFYINLARDVDKKYVVPRASEKDYIKRLNEIIELEGIQLVHAQPDVEVGRISEDREKLKAKVFLPDKATVKICHNKFELIRHLNDNGLPAARHVLIETEEDIKFAFREFGKRIWLRAIRGAGGRGSLPVEKFEHAKAWVDYWNGWRSFVAEEYLPGKNMAWQGIFKNGELITSLTWERIEYIISHVSPSGITGTPSVARIITNGKVNETAVNVVYSLTKKPNGIFSIDFKENKDGVPCVTEINPGRFFTPSYMYVEAGVNLPLVYLKLAFDEDVQNLPKFDAFKRKILWIRGIDIEPVAVEI
ncbi:MAG TPA: ATP-grasp domain-containing protein [Candidatus Bathyarchaeota archaeon]|nr:ATP-grasp domain-containing protein [Candidatus Bathyarchaeota archaeon]HEX69341.1 ATP-grasp domain-containing protein [Candidatus Bathyarchaeota archaeon]